MVMGRPRYPSSMIDASAVVAFWREAGPSKWFNGGEAFDAKCRAELLTPHLLAARRELDQWMEGDAAAEGALALLLLLDQAPRSEEHTSELQSRENLVCRLLLEKK